MENAIKNLKYLEFGVLAMLLLIILGVYSDMLGMIFMMGSLALAAFYTVIAQGKLNDQENMDHKELIAKKMGLLGLAVVTTGMLFKMKYYPGASTMLMIGTFTMAFVLLLLATIKDDGSQNQYANNNGGGQEPLTFSKKQLMPRVLIALALGGLTWLGFLKVNPYTANPVLLEALSDPYFMEGKPLSENDARIVAAWHDISHGISKEKALKTYGVSRDDYDSNAEALAYGGKENIPQQRNIKITGNYEQNLPARECVQPADTAYLRSLRPVYYKQLIDEHLNMAMDLEILASHTDNEDFKAFVRKNYKKELETIKDFQYHCLMTKSDPRVN